MQQILKKIWIWIFSPDLGLRHGFAFETKCARIVHNFVTLIELQNVYIIFIQGQIQIQIPENNSNSKLNPNLVITNPKLWIYCILKSNYSSLFHLHLLFTCNFLYSVHQK